MGRALTLARSSHLGRLFAFFGVEVDPEQVRSCAARISERFLAEADAIERHCAGLRERERFILLRAALVQAYERARDGVEPTAPSRARARTASASGTAPAPSAPWR